MSDRFKLPETNDEYATCIHCDELKHYTEFSDEFDDLTCRACARALLEEEDENRQT